ncbi:unnamed protein product (macronuclear) [Paramecium tetraurelia]|uniref:HTH myb-type domain-containing protein n=1 Tax=Paramecium tetraurelia TaxID=5888 RepID=A0C7C7_PARTE|nr:uncharacterized protein GSPATT00035824001 [Paramecium tetraurelia]CAK66694.1 unnamed protein product [Paramecium tetraurelia]|eukprot:XP_001434091.1 hypothetical protein (macronuclear) [Paramecium tetraurelia strain d4-2]
MDEAIQIKQYILNDGFDEYDQDYHFRLSQQHVEEESLEHLYYSIIQCKSTQDENDSNKNQSQKRRINDMRFSYLEDKRILELVIQLGPNFNKIVKYFPGKTMNMIKNRYYKKLRYNKEEYLSDMEFKKTNHKGKKSN